MAAERLSRSADKVQDAQNAAGIDLRVLELAASTRSAEESAEAIGCEVGQIAKSLLFRGAVSGKPIMTIASGANLVDDGATGVAVGEGLAMANADYVREHTGFAIGGVPPVGHAQPMPVYVDQDLREFQEIWTAAGTPRAVFSLTPAQLSALTRATIIVVSCDLRSSDGSGRG